MFRCKACYYIHEGESAPEVCPKCGAPKEQFELLNDSLVSLIERARKSNVILNNTLTILEQLEKLAKDGVDDNLDPSCLNLFQRIADCSLLLKNMVKAEIQSHIIKNKWG